MVDVCKTELAKGAAVCDDGGYRIVGYLFALCQVNFENIGAVEGKSCDRGVGYALATVEFELSSGVSKIS